MEKMPNWDVSRDRGFKGYPFAIVAPYHDGLPGTAVLGSFAYLPHAQLAAAAPDLLEVLRWVERWMSGYGTASKSEMREVVRSAIAKAEADR